MNFTLKKIICSNCGKEHLTDNFELIPMMGFDWKNMKKNLVYLHDTGHWQVNCECGYTTTLDTRYK